MTRNAGEATEGLKQRANLGCLSIDAKAEGAREVCG